MKRLHAWIRHTERKVRIWLRPRAAPLRPILRSLRPDRKFPKRYAPDWYARIYAELGFGFWRAEAFGAAPWVEAAPDRCLRCPPGVVLGLLPGEEVMFRDALNDTDFRLRNNPALPGRKMIICGKVGRCGGHMPYVCRTSPAQFSGGLFYVDESRCATSAAAFLAEHGAAVRRSREIVHAHGLHLEKLGYRRVVDLDTPDARAAEKSHPGPLLRAEGPRVRA